MKKKIFGALVIVAIAVGAMINVNLNKVSNKGDLALANVEALANAETANCPDFNYVPDKYIVSSVLAGTYTCTTAGSLTVGGSTLTGSYAAGQSYAVSIENKNCSGSQRGACCDQRSVGASIIK